MTLSNELSTELRRGIAEHGLDPVADCILANAGECYAMVAEGRDDGSVPGNTRFGGAPDLPASSRWPCDGDPDDADSRFSNFIAQINFTELPPLPSGSPMPSSGMLYLFVRAMESAAEPVLLDAVFFDGDPASLRRAPVPDPERLADEYLVDLQPLKIRAMPAVSLAGYRRGFRAEAERMAGDVDDLDGRLIGLESSLERPGQIGQMLGFANAPDARQNLYRQLVLARLGKRRLTYNDYWDSMEEYEAYVNRWRDRGEERMVKQYEAMRDGVVWLVQHRDSMSQAVAEWRLLLRIESNPDMNLDMMDGDPLYVFIRDEDLARRNFSDLAGEVTQG